MTADPAAARRPWLSLIGQPDVRLLLASPPRPAAAAAAVVSPAPASAAPAGSRARLLAAIVAEPGLSKADLARRAGLAWNLCDHHLGALERAGDALLVKLGREVHAFPRGWARAAACRRVLERDRVARRVLEQLGAAPCRTQAELRERSGHSPRSLRRALGLLVRHGLVSRDAGGIVLAQAPAS
jgi:predicted transcriptional regulator